MPLPHIWEGLNIPYFLTALIKSINLMLYLTVDVIFVCGDRIYKTNIKSSMPKMDIGLSIVAKEPRSIFKTREYRNGV